MGVRIRTPRNPIRVIEAILAEVPEERVQLRASLYDLERAAGFKSPEAQVWTWVFLQAVLEDALSLPPRLVWEKRISNIMEGRAQIPE